MHATEYTRDPARNRHVVVVMLVAYHDARGCNDSGNVYNSPTNQTIALRVISRGMTDVT